MTNPMLAMPPLEKKLRESPLERVLAAVAFSPVLKINDASGAGVAPFQDQVRSVYPEVVLEHDEGVQFEADGDGKMLPPKFVDTPVWRLYDSRRAWQLSLTAQSVSLESLSDYRGRDDLVERLLFVCEALFGAYAPSEVTKVGFRYFNVFASKKLGRLHELVKPEALGFGAPGLSRNLLFSQSLGLYKTDEGMLAIKSGILGIGMVHEFRLEPATEKSWILDLDAWRDLEIAFDRGSLISYSRALTDRICSTFRWIVTDEFIGEHS